MAQQHARHAILITCAREGVQATLSELTKGIPHFDSFRLWYLDRLWQTSETSIAICDSQTQCLSDIANWKAVSGLLHKKCRNAFHYDSRLIKPDVIGQAAACNPEEQEEVADGMALKLNTFVYLAHRK